ncbi:DMT family transporter [Pseudonocardia zijingensis]|uniref:DMT family transporter n=1 Tax=Pseudonocardia zijingensis TaxID=153376 RepID=A0ABP3YIK0_9PSEU
MSSSATRPAVPASRYRWAALGAVAVTVLAWASAFVAIRAVGVHYDPGPMTLGRLLIGSLALGAGLLVTRRWVWPTRREWALVVLCGVAWFAIYNLALNAAEQRIDAGTTAMLVNIGPILIALFAGLLLGEGFPRWLVIGALVAFCGAVLVGAATSNTAEADLLGVLLCVVAAVTYAIGVLSQKFVLHRLPGLQVTWLACTIGAACTLPFAPGLVHGLAAAPGAATAGLVYLGAVPTALAFSTWAYALARMDAGRLGVSTYLVPPITIVMSAALLGEAPPLLAIVGGAICLVGVGLSRRRSRPAQTRMR